MSGHPNRSVGAVWAVWAAAAAVLVMAAAAGAQPKPALKVFISVDMEGIWGVVAGDQTSAASPEYGPARKWMAEDVNAAAAGAFEAGATEVVVNDSHGSMRNILASDLDGRAALLSGSPKPLSMMQGLDETFDACLFIGYHAPAGSAPAILDHTISGATVYAIRVNGRELPELGINALIAAHFGVPVVMLSGDTETCRRAREILGEDLIVAPVKEAMARFAARMLPRTRALALLREQARAGVARAAAAKPWTMAPPFTFTLEFHSSNQAEASELVPGVRRTGPRAVEFEAGDFITGFKLLRALIALAS